MDGSQPIGHEPCPECGSNKSWQRQIRYVRRHQKSHSLGTVARIGAVAPRELAEFARLDITHPPTPHRVNLLRQNRILQPQMMLSAATDASLMAELAQQAPTIQRRMADQFMSAIDQGIY